MFRLFSCIFVKSSNNQITYCPSNFPNLLNCKFIYLNVNDIPSNPPSSAFPTDILQWMKKNANPRQTFKLMKTHKYFWQKSFPFSPMKGVYAYCERIEFITVNRKIRGSYFKDIKNDLWITKSFESCLPNISLLLSKVVYCDIKELSLFNQYLSLNEFQFLTASSTLKNIQLVETSITESNNYFVTLEDIFECIKNVEIIFFRDLVHTFKSLQNITILKNLKRFKLWNFPESMNFETLSNFILKHRNVEFDILIWDNFSIERTKQLQFQVDKIIKSSSPTFPIPYFEFPGQTEKSKNRLLKLRQARNMFNF